MSKPTFGDAFEFSRVPTNSYIHFANIENKRIETTGHVGGLFVLPKSGSSSATNQKEAFQKLIKGTSGNTGGRFAGSNGKNGFHTRRDNVIEKVKNKYKSDGKTSPAKKANTEVLKFMINNTVGYKDNIPKNQTKFVGFTTDGLDLEDSESREYALKHYQVVRDTLKLAVLKFEDRLNEEDSASSTESNRDSNNNDGSAANNSTKNGSPCFSLLNRKLQRTVLNADYHIVNEGDKRELSPLRIDSPYCRANIEINLNMLKQATTFEDICKVYASPSPTISPSEKSTQDKKEFNDIKKKLDFDNISSNKDFMENDKKLTVPEGFSDVDADGLCFYHAILKQLSDTQNARQLRQRVIDQIREDPKRYESFIAGIGIQEINQPPPTNLVEAFANHHLNGKSGDTNVWADYVIISATADVLGMIIEVHMFNLDGSPQVHLQGENAGDHVVVKFSPKSRRKQKILVVGNINNMHFVSGNAPENSDLIGLASAFSWINLSED